MENKEKDHSAALLPGDPLASPPTTKALPNCGACIHFDGDGCLQPEMVRGSFSSVYWRIPDDTFYCSYFEGRATDPRLAASEAAPLGPESARSLDDRVYGAVHEELMKLRVKLHSVLNGRSDIDHIVYHAQNRACDAAVAALKIGSGTE